MTAAITCTGDDLTLVCGKSSTGKTTLAKRLLSRQSKPVKVINDSTDDLDPSWQKIQWPELESQSGIALLVEDVINATPAEFNHLSRLLNYGAHHRYVGRRCSLAWSAAVMSLSLSLFADLSLQSIFWFIVFTITMCLDY